MTIIINTGHSLVTDRAKAVEDHTAEGDKSFERRGFCWALAGQNPSRRMLEAQTAEELVDAFSAEAHFRDGDALVVLRAECRAEQFWVVQPAKGDSFVATTVLEPWTAVGCYRVEWARYLASNTDLDQQLLAEGFVALVHSLNGLAAQVDIAVPLS